MTQINDLRKLRMSRTFVRVKIQIDPRSYETVKPLDRFPIFEVLTFFFLNNKITYFYNSWTHTAYAVVGKIIKNIFIKNKLFVFLKTFSHVQVFQRTNNLKPPLSFFPKVNGIKFVVA